MEAPGPLPAPSGTLSILSIAPAEAPSNLDPLLARTGADNEHVPPTQKPVVADFLLPLMCEAYC